MKPCENRMLLSLGESDWRSMFWHLSFPWLPRVSFYVDPPHRMSIQDPLGAQLQRTSTCVAILERPELIADLERSVLISFAIRFLHYPNGAFQCKTYFQTVAKVFWFFIFYFLGGKDVGKVVVLDSIYSLCIFFKVSICSFFLYHLFIVILAAICFIE